MRKRILVFSIVLVLVAGITGTALAAGWGGGRWLNRNCEWVPPVSKLELSDEQYQQVRKLHEDFFVKTEGLRDQIRRKMFEIRNLYLQKNPDLKAIEAIKKELEELKNQLLQLQQEKMEALKEVLTDEQLKQLEEIKGQGFKGKGRKRPMGSFMPGGQGKRGNGGFCWNLF